MDSSRQQARGMKRSRRDPAKFRAIIRRIQAECDRDGRFKGMTEEEVLRQLRRTREEVCGGLLENLQSGALKPLRPTLRLQRRN